MIFHVVGLKCANCGSYNTCRSADTETDESPQIGATEGTVPDEGASGDSSGTAANTEENN